jgi:hypothetical protein
VLFAFLGNTLFLTVLVSMLTNTFSNIVHNAVQEISFRRAVLTFEGVKSDAIFAYPPPFNIVALAVWLPARFFFTPRMFHKIHVACVRVLNLPALLIISWYERRTLWISDKRKIASARKIDWKNPHGPRATPAQYWAISRFSVHGDIHAAFDIEPPQSMLDKLAGEDDLHHSDDMGILSNKKLNSQFLQLSEGRRASQDLEPKRRFSMTPRRKKSRRKIPKQEEPRTDIEDEQRLKEQFHTSDDGEDESDHPAGYKKLNRRERMDSIVDLEGGAENRMLEALTRLHNVEGAVDRIEAMLQELINGDTSSENSKGKEELNEELRSGSLQ